MTDKTYESIVAALDRLASGNGSRKSGKITAVSLAAEAGIGKATLYRYFNDHDKLKRDYDSVRRRGIGPIPDGPATLQDALANAQAEIKELRRELAEADIAFKAKAQQLLLLWAENKSLRRELERDAASSIRSDNVTLFSGREP
jgi:AcrR family transcriptional regulator